MHRTLNDLFLWFNLLGFKISKIEIITFPPFPRSSSEQFIKLCISDGFIGLEIIQKAEKQLNITNPYCFFT
jgi:hypothetical protein